MNPAFRSTLIPAAAGRPGDDPIFALNAAAQRRAAAGEPVINATLGALLQDHGQLAVMPSVLEAFAAVPREQAAAYAPIAGPAPFLRAVVADVYGDGPLAAATVAAATPGGSGALYQAVTNFLEPGQALLTTDYYWGPYQTIALHAGRQLATFPMFTPAGGFAVDAFAAALDAQLAHQGRALVFLNTPCHNPTGYSLDEREWDALAGVVQRAGERAPVALLVDLAYARFATGAPDWTRHVARMATSASVLVAWSASKSFAQYGARIGALLATHGEADERTRLANALSFACRGTWSNCNHLGLLGIAAVLADPARRARADAEREQLRRLLDTRVAAFCQEAARVGLRHPRYEGGFFVAVFVDDVDATMVQLQQEGVFVVPLPVAGGGAVRVGLCATPVQRVPALVAALARAAHVRR